MRLLVLYKKNILITIIFIIVTLFISGISKREALAEENSNTSHEYNIKSHYIDVLRGRDGRDGLTGPPGEKGDKGEPGLQGDKRGTRSSRYTRPPGSSSGGTVYTRWDRTVCPNTSGTELVYKGLVAGTDSTQSGGGANYLCTTEQPQYLSGTVLPYHSRLTEYEHTVFNTLHDQNVP